MRLAEKAAAQPDHTSTPSRTVHKKRDGLTSVSNTPGSSSRVTKPDRRGGGGGRVIASRYLAAVANSNKPITNVDKKPNISSRRISRRYTAVSVRATPKDNIDHTEPLSTSTSNNAYASYIQWLLIEARSEMAFVEAKEAANEELRKLREEAEQDKQELMEEERGLKLMQEYAALSRWLDGNRQYLLDMGKQVSQVKESYTRFSDSLAQTTRAIPVSGVHIRDGKSLVNSMQEFVNAIEQHFPKDLPEVQNLYAVASRLNQYYSKLAQEQELLSECSRLKQSLEHTTSLAISRRL